MIVIGLIYNLAVLVALSVLSGFIDARFKRTKLSGKLFQGLLFGITAIIGMLYPFVFENGLIFDGRSIVISLCALFFGPISGTIASLLAILYRLHIGGPGTLMGTLVIITSFSIGLIFYYLRLKTFDKVLSKWRLYLIGLIVHAVMMLLVLLLPSEEILRVYKIITLTVMVFYPIATVIIGKILLDQEENHNFVKMLQNREKMFRTTFYSISDAVITTDTSGRITQMNSLAESLITFKESDSKGKMIDDLIELKIDNTISKVNNTIQQVLEHGNIVENSNPSLVLDNKNNHIPVSYSCSPIINDNREIIGASLILRDQTKERASKKSLAASEVRFRRLFESANDGILILNAKSGKVVDANRFFLLNLGYDKDLIVGRYFRDLNFINKTIFNQDTFLKLVNSEKVYFDDIQFTCANKTNANFEFVSSSYSAGDYKYVQCNIRDITDRKLAVEALQKNEAMLSVILNSIPQFIFWKDVNSIYIGCNSAFAQAVGLEDPKSIIGKSDYDIHWDEEEAEAYIRDDREVISTKMPKIHIIESQRQTDGKQIWVDTSKLPLLDNNNNVYGILGVYENITDRRLAEELLKSSELRFRSVWENSKDGMRLTNEDGIIIMVNDAYCKLVELDKDSLQGKPLSAVYKDEPNSHVIDNAKKLFAKREVEPYFEKEMILWNGKNMWLAVTNSYIEYNEKQPLLLSIFRDITSGKKTEKELIEAKENAEELNRLKTSFLANMSHELRTPMIGILGYSELLIQEIENTGHLKMLNNINDSGKRLLNTLNSVLDLSRIESNKLKINKQLINIPQFVKKIVSTYLAFAKSKNLELKADIHNPEIYSYLDKRLISLILDNLINNALKYTAHGYVLVDVYIETIEQNNYSVIKVSDTGIGIPEDSLHLIFEEFRQVSEGFSRQFEGSGIGLTITKKTVELLNGSINVESTVGEGSTFTIRFPNIQSKGTRIIEAKPVSKISAAFHHTENKLKLLLVDNDLDTLNFVTTILESTYLVDTAENGHTALELVSQTKYDIILMDIGLGMELNGIETTSLIRQIDGYKNTPIVAFTAYAMTGDKESFLDKGLTHYISKPFTIESLKELLAEISEKINLT